VSVREYLGAAALDYLRAAADRLAHTLDLAASEARLAAATAVTMLVLALLTVAFVLVGWAFLVAAIAQLGVQAGFSWTSVALAMSAVHVGAAIGMFAWAMRLSRNLTMPALRKALAGDGAGSAPAP
jgi:hypothetical protein